MSRDLLATFDDYVARRASGGRLPMGKVRKDHPIPVGAHLQGDNPQHEMVLTQSKNSNSKLIVRCKCAAEYRNVSNRYFNYDWISEVDTAEEAVAVYRFHLETGVMRVHYRARYV